MQPSEASPPAHPLSSCYFTDPLRRGVFGVSLRHRSPDALPFSSSVDSPTPTVEAAEESVLLSHHEALRRMGPEYTQCRMDMDPHIVLRCEEKVVNSLTGAYSSSGYPNLTKGHHPSVYGAFSNLRAVRIDTLNLPPTETIVISKRSGGPSWHRQDGRPRKLPDGGGGEDAKGEVARKPASRHPPEAEDAPSPPQPLLPHHHDTSHKNALRGDGGASSMSASLDKEHHGNGIPSHKDPHAWKNTKKEEEEEEDRDRVLHSIASAEGLRVSSYPPEDPEDENEAEEEEVVVVTEEPVLHGVVSVVPIHAGGGGGGLEMDRRKGEKAKKNHRIAATTDNGHPKPPHRNGRTMKHPNLTKTRSPHTSSSGSGHGDGAGTGSPLVPLLPGKKKEGHHPQHGTMSVSPAHPSPPLLVSLSSSSVGGGNSDTVHPGGGGVSSSSSSLSSPSFGSPTLMVPPLHGKCKSPVTRTIRHGISPHPRVPTPPPASSSSSKGLTEDRGVMDTLVHIQWKREGHLFHFRGQNSHGAVAPFPSLSGDGGSSGAEKPTSAYNEHLATFPEGIVSIHSSDLLHRLVVEGDIGLGNDDGDAKQHDKTTTTTTTATGEDEKGNPEASDRAHGTTEEGLPLTYHTWQPPSDTPSKKGYCFRNPTAAGKKKRGGSRSRTVVHAHPPSTQRHPKRSTQKTHAGKKTPTAPSSTTAAAAPPSYSTDSLLSSPSSASRSSSSASASSHAAAPDALPELLYAQPKRPLAHGLQHVPPVQHTLTAVNSFAHLTLYFTAHQDGKVLLTLPIQTYSACLLSRRITAHRLLLLARRETIGGVGGGVDPPPPPPPNTTTPAPPPLASATQASPAASRKAPPPSLFSSLSPPPLSSSSASSPPLRFTSIPLRGGSQEESDFFTTTTVRRPPPPPSTLTSSLFSGMGKNTKEEEEAEDGVMEEVPLFRAVDMQHRTISALPVTLTVSPLVLVGNENGDILLLDILSSRIVLRLNYAGYASSSSSGTSKEAAVPHSADLPPSSSPTASSVPFAPHDDGDGEMEMGTMRMVKGENSTSSSTSGGGKAGGVTSSPVALSVATPTTSRPTRSSKVVYAAVSCITEMESGTAVFLTSLVQVARRAKHDTFDRTRSPLRPLGSEGESDALAREENARGGGGGGAVWSAAPHDIGPSIFAVGFDSGDVLLMCLMCEGGWVLRHFSTAFFGVYPIEDIAVQMPDVMLRLWMSYVPSTSSESPPRAMVGATRSQRLPTQQDNGGEGVPPLPITDVTRHRPCRKYASRTIVMAEMLTGVPHQKEGTGVTPVPSPSSSSTSKTMSLSASQRGGWGRIGNGGGGGTAPPALAAMACGGGAVLLLQIPELVVLHKLHVHEYNAVGTLYTLRWCPSHLGALLHPDLLLATGEDDTITSFQVVMPPLHGGHRGSLRVGGGGSESTPPHHRRPPPPPCLSSAGLQGDGGSLPRPTTPSAAPTASLLSLSDGKDLPNDEGEEGGESPPPLPATSPFSRLLSTTPPHLASSIRASPSRPPLPSPSSHSPAASSSAVALLRPPLSASSPSPSLQSSLRGSVGSAHLHPPSHGYYYPASFPLIGSVEDDGRASLRHSRSGSSGGIRGYRGGTGGGGGVALRVLEKKLFHRSWSRSLTVLPLVEPATHSGKGLPKYHGVVLMVVSYDGTVSFWPHLFASTPSSLAPLLRRPHRGASVLSSTSSLSSSSSFSALSSEPPPPALLQHLASSLSPPQKGASLSISSLSSTSLSVRSSMPRMGVVPPGGGLSSPSALTALHPPRPHTAAPQQGGGGRLPSEEGGGGAPSAPLSSSWKPLLLLKGPTSVYKLHTDLAVHSACGGAGTSFFMISACCRGKVKFWSIALKE